MCTFAGPGRKLLVLLLLQAVYRSYLCTSHTLSTVSCILRTAATRSRVLVVLLTCPLCFYYQQYAVCISITASSISLILRYFPYCPECQQYTARTDAASNNILIVLLPIVMLCCSHCCQRQAVYCHHCCCYEQYTVRTVVPPASSALAIRLYTGIVNTASSILLVKLFCQQHTVPPDVLLAAFPYFDQATTFSHFFFVQKTASLNFVFAVVYTFSFLFRPVSRSMAFSHTVFHLTLERLIEMLRY